MPRRLDLEALGRQLLRRLALEGPSSTAELLGHLGISQPTFSRLSGQLGAELLVVGRARATRYAARRRIDGVGQQVPVYEIDELGEARKLATLHAILPEGFYVEATTEDVESAFYKDLPYFLSDLRPAGFLGRLIPALHPELEAPSDITLWSADHCLRYITRYGWNLIGNLIVGDPAFDLYLERTESRPELIRAADRERRYPELAADVMAAGVPGSSAAGEQPKFLAWRAPKRTAVLVKFSPPVRDATSRRIADLLVGEHLAHDVLRRHGRKAAASELLTAGERVFLEVERFDRVAGDGRRGLLSLLPIDAEFVGRLRSWTDSAAALRDQGRIEAGTLAEIAWLELFSRLIANTDLHAGNLSFLMRGSTILSLAPAYDVAPTLYAPRHGHLQTPAFEPPRPSPQAAGIWEEVCVAAQSFWGRLAAHPAVSKEFRTLAKANVAAVGRARDLGRKLPRG